MSWKTDLMIIGGVGVGAYFLVNKFFPDWLKGFSKAGQSAGSDTGNALNAGYASLLDLYYKTQADYVNYRRAHGDVCFGDSHAPGCPLGPPIETPVVAGEWVSAKTGLPYSGPRQDYADVPVGMTPLSQQYPDGMPGYNAVYGGTSGLKNPNPYAVSEYSPPEPLIYSGSLSPVSNAPISVHPITPFNVANPVSAIF